MEFPYWPDPDFIKQTLEAFPDKGIATPDEARVRSLPSSSRPPTSPHSFSLPSQVLITEGGYSFVDVRPGQELDDAGKYSKSINVPLYNAKWHWDPEARKKKFIKEENPKFIEMIKKKFPDPESKILVVGRDGKTYAIEALEALDDAGYVNIVGLRGGYYGWFKVYDNNLRRRRADGYTEKFDGIGETACGIHGTGAGFDRVDKVESWQPPVFEEA